MNQPDRRLSGSSSSARELSSVKVLAPSGIDRFACTGCGGCCKLWGVWVDKPSFERAKAFLENPPAPRPNPELPWYVVEKGEPHYQTTANGTCVFLDKDNRCYLHTHDPMLKSRVCRDYPHGGMMTPRGFEMSLTFSSFGAFQHVLAHPEPFALIETEMPRPPDQPHLPPTPIQFPRPYGWETYFQIEGILLDFIGRMDSLDDALIASARFLAAVEQEPDGKKLRRQLRNRQLHPIAFMERSPISNLDAAYRLIEEVLTIRAAFLKNSPHLRSCVEDIETLTRDMERGPAEEKTGRALFYRRVRQTFYDPGRDCWEPAIRKFIQYKLFQKTFFFEYGLVRGFNVLCFCYAVLRLLLILHARRPPSPHSPRMADLYKPIYFVERHFFHSGRFLIFWKEVFQGNLLTRASLSEILIRV